MTITKEPPSQADAQPDKIINPWLSIWLKPGETIMHIVTTDPKRHVSLLAALSGIATALSNAITQGLGLGYHIVSVLGVTLILGSLGGLLRVAIEGWLLSWVGSWLGGETTSEEMRAASAWSYLPSIIPLALYIPILIIGALLITNIQDVESILPLFFIALVPFLFMIGIVTFLWRVFILASSIIKLQGFNIGQAIANMLLAYGISLAFLFMIGIAIVFII